MQHEDPTVPDTAMATGNDVGEPGGPTPQPPLDPDEQALLEDLLDSSDAPDAVHDAPEDSAAAARGR